MNDNVTTTGTLESDKNHTVEQKISRPKELILLFWIDEEDPSRTLFAEAAQTRMANIKKSNWYNENIHKVHCPPIQALHEMGTIITNWTNEYGGKDKVKTREIGLFSHSAFYDGPLAYLTPNNPPLDPDPANPYGDDQMAIIGGWDAIDFNWIETGAAMIVFYGCNSGLDSDKGFSKKLSVLTNLQNVTVWGQSNYSYPSFFPDYRAIAIAQGKFNIGWDIGPIYMIGDVLGKGADVIMSGVGMTSSPEELKKQGRPVAPFNYFKNGNKIGSSHQGIFNDHR